MMVPMTDLAARAADPRTSQQELYQLANDHPDLRPLIAENPNTYPDLVDWLGSLGDPEIDAALDRRDQATRAMPVLPQDQPTEAFSAVGEPRHSQPERRGPAHEEHQDDGAYYPAAPVYPSPAAGYPPHHGYQEQAWPGYAEEAAPARRRGGAGCLLFALLGFLLVAGTIAALFLLPLTFFGDDGDEEPQQEEVIEQEAPEQQPAEEPAPEEEDATAEEDEPEEGEEELERPAPEDAVEVESFSAPSENIHCQMSGDEVSCTINDYSFEAPAGCSGDVTLTVSQDGEAQTDCGTSVGSQATSLNYGQAASNGDFACTSGEAGFECWSTRTGNGFFLAREDFSLVN